MKGIEPSNTRIKNECLTTWRHSKFSKTILPFEPDKNLKIKIVFPNIKKNIGEEKTKLELDKKHYLQLKKILVRLASELSQAP